MKITIVIPCFNEAENIPLLVDKLSSEISKIKRHFVMSSINVLFIDDGSSDDTLTVIRSLHKSHMYLSYISFARNFGHQNALKAGICHSNSDFIVTMDADLQHPPELIFELLLKCIEGYDIVYTRRIDSSKTPLLKRFFSSLYYKLINSFSDTQIDQGAADFRVITKKAASLVRQAGEGPTFLRGLFAWSGFRQTAIEYTPPTRTAGVTKYTWPKMASLAIDGITSSSIKPLRLATIIGFIFSSFTLIYGIYALLVFMFSKQVISGWTSVVLSVLFVGGVQLMMLGVIGEYLGKVFVQTWGRPTYIISSSFP